MLQSHRFSNKLEIVSKVLAVATAFVIPLSTALMNIFFIATVALSILAGNWKDKAKIIAFNRFALLFLVFFGLFVIGLIYTTAPLKDGVAMLIKYNKFLLGAFFIPLFVEERWRKYAINAFIVAVMIMLIGSYLKLFGIIHYQLAKYGNVSIFKNHIAGNFLLAFTAYLLLHKITKSNKYWWLATLLFLLTVYNALFLNTGRTGYFILGSLIALFLWQKFSWKGLLIAVIAIFILGGSAFLFSKSFHERAITTITNIHHYQPEKSMTSVGLRMTFAKNSIHLIKQHPIIGTGTGSFTTEYAKIKPTPEVLTHNPHNQYLDIGVQFGIIGMLILLFMFYRQWRDSKYLPQDMRYLAEAVVLAVVLGGLANSWLMDSTEGHLYVYFISVAFAAWQPKAIKPSR